MLQDRIDNDEHYRILIDHRNPLRIVLATQAMLEAKGPVEPLWDREAGDARSMAALLRWVAIRRDRWQEWGQLAEALGPAAFYQHMRERMDAEPPAECIGTMVTRLDDAHEIAISESMHGPHGLFYQPLYVHRFVSPGARDRFYDWMYCDDNIHAVDALARLGYADGALALGKALDRIAEDRPAGNRAERRRRAKAEAKAANAQRCRAPA